MGRNASHAHSRRLKHANKANGVGVNLLDKEYTSRLAAKLFPSSRKRKCFVRRGGVGGDFANHTLHDCVFVQAYVFLSERMDTIKIQSGVLSEPGSRDPSLGLRLLSIVPRNPTLAPQIATQHMQAPMRHRLFSPTSHTRTHTHTHTHP